MRILRNTVETGTITFVEDKKENFEYYCTVGKHRETGMKSTLGIE